MKFMVETSARHIHLTQESVEKLFGAGHQLQPRKNLSYPGIYACHERLTVVGPKRSIENISVLGPCRTADQVELSGSDARTLGIDAPIRESGHLAGSGACKLIGPAGEIDLSEGVIIAKRHIHVTDVDAEKMGIENGQIVKVALGGPERRLIFDDVVVRVNHGGITTMHIDTDESQAAGSPTEGEIVFDGEKINGLPTHIIAQKGIARTFQNIRLFGDLSVYDNLLTACQKNITYSLFHGFLRTPNCRRQEKAARAECDALLEEMELTTQSGQKASNLPYGMQRKLEIARALATHPKVLLLDEPAAGMNEEESVQLSAFIRNIRDSRDLTIVIIDHHMDVIMSICDRVSVLNFGTLLADGEPSEIQSNPEVIAAYLGVDE